MLEFINKYLLGTAVPILLICGGIYYTVKLRAFHLRHPQRVISVLLKRNTASGTSPFRAVTLALAGTLGVGNIVGVAAAISLGGFGAVFWMWVSALCAMILKYAEILLAVDHRIFDENGSPHGSAMLYIKDFFSSVSLKRLGGIISAVFALFCILNSLTMGSMIQANAVSESLEGVFGVPPLFVGIFLCISCAVIIPRGSASISKLTELLVPIMALGYVLISLYSLFIKRGEIISAFSLIVKDAFAPSSAYGGVLGFLLSRSLRFGAMRGLISNEAGCGTAPTAHAGSNTKSAVEQGFWGIFEVFVDTILLCTMTALVIIVNYDSLTLRGSWIMLTIDAYSVALGNISPIFISISVLAFGFATMVCWAHYGIEAVRYLSGRRSLRICFIFIYCSTSLIGSIISADLIWQTADLAIGVMTLINLPIICFMSKEVKRETEIYFNKPMDRQR